MEGGGYIRTSVLSWRSVEVYVLILLLAMFVRIFLSRKWGNVDRKLVAMYLLSIVFTDSTYRIASMQISEVIIVVAAVLDILRHKFRIVINTLTAFMLSLSGIFLVSDIVASYSGIYASWPAFSYMAGNNIKFLLITYMVSKIIREISDGEVLRELLIKGGGA